MLIKVGEAQEGAGIRGLNRDQGAPLMIERAIHIGTSDLTSEMKLGEPLPSPAETKIEARPFLLAETDRIRRLQIEIGVLRIGLRARHEALDEGPKIDRRAFHHCLIDIPLAPDIDSRIIPRRYLEAVELRRKQRTVLSGRELSRHGDGRGGKIDLAEACLIIPWRHTESELAGAPGGLRPAGNEAIDGGSAQISLDIEGRGWPCIGSRRD